MKPLVGIVGGSGLTSIRELEIVSQRIVRTPFGEASAPVIVGRLSGQRVAFLARHGQGHTIPPHQINYRANIYALAEVGVRSVVAVAAVGGIGDAFGSGQIAIPDQIIDYTHSRNSTYFDGNTNGVTHVDFSYPYSESIRQEIIQSATRLGLDVRTQATYAATQGPRFETAAEIDRIDRDGGHVVGMTGMPEAVLAREMELEYATIALVVNPAAGRASEEISLEAIMQELEDGMTVVRGLLVECLPGVEKLVAT